MDSAQHDFGEIKALKVTAIGESGKRTFYFSIASDYGCAKIWLEKEELYALAMALKQLLHSLAEDEEMGIGLGLDAEIDYSLSEPDLLEFKMGYVTLHYDSDLQRFFFSVFDVQEGKAADAKVRFLANAEQVEELVGEALSVYAGGRPICPFCHRPVDPGAHFCPSRNGSRQSNR